MDQEVALGIGLLAGAMSGAAVMWLVARTRAETTRAALAAQYEPEIARLTERVGARDEQIRVVEGDISRLEAEVEAHESQITAESERRATLQASIAQLETQLREERRSSEEKVQLLQSMRENVQESFKALSAEALRSNNKSFLELAEQNLTKFQSGARTDLEKREIAIAELVRPLKESLERVDVKIESLEKSRLSTQAAMTEQMRQLSEQHSMLRAETSKVAQALHAPNTRGRWGEIQLRRVVEMAGMVEYCDFLEQQTHTTDDGRLRPDLIVRLPNNRTIVVDAKVPLQAYQEAIEAKDEETRRAKLAEHARHVRTHLQLLGSKNYWSAHQPGPDFVIMFLAGETIYNAALEADGSLIEYGVDNKVLMTTPTGLIGLLRVVAFGWRQEALEKNAQQISELGRELYGRIRSFAANFSGIRAGLERAVKSYNDSVGSLERRVLVSARRFQDLSASTDAEIPLIEPLDVSVRQVTLESTSGVGAEKIASEQGALPGVLGEGAKTLL